jgi:hypothetical protein
LRRLRGAFWRRRVALWLIRAAWLSLLVPTTCMAGYLWLGWQVRWQDWLIPMLVVGLLSFLWSMRPIRLNKMTEQLDRRLGLRARLITAYEVGNIPGKADQADNLVVQRLLQESVNILIDLRRYIRSFGRSFWVEMQALIAVTALLTALLMLDALTPHLPNASLVELPPSWQEPKADAVLPPDAQLRPPPFQQPEPQVQQTMSQEQLQQALEALADALRDQAITRSIAESLDRGDLSGAANELRRLADQLGQLSEQARAGLGQSLQEAAENSGAPPDLTEPLQSGSSALEQDNLQAAQQALEQLADALESLQEAPQESAQVQPPNSGQPQENGQTQENSQAQSGENQEGQTENQNEGNQPPPEGSGSGAGSGNQEGEGGDQPASEEERLGVEGQPLELESDPTQAERVLQPAELDAQASGESTQDSPFARQPANRNPGDLGPDPLAYPWEKRDVIRRYFTP